MTKLNRLLARTHQQAAAIAGETCVRASGTALATELAIVHFKHVDPVSRRSRR